MGRSSPLVGLLVVGLVLAGTVAAFAITAGWVDPERLTPDRVVDALSRRGGDPTGHRRNHAKGACFTGHFEAGGMGAALSAAPMLAAGSYPVVGRFAIATGDPTASDASGRVKSLALRIVAPDGQEWRSAMNASPVFVVSTVEAFYELTLAAAVDPTTGRTDPAAMGRFVARHPEATDFLDWARSAPWTKSYADVAYNSLNAFRFRDHEGAIRAVRWSLLPTAAAEFADPASLAELPRDFLERDLEARLAEGPLRWRLLATLAAPGDPTADATIAWPPDRPQVELGLLVVERSEPEETGPCRDFTFDPLVLPDGIEPSDDPLLAARSSSYANSFDRRMREQAR